MKILKKSLTALLVLVILLGLCPPGLIPTASASAYTAYIDVSGHWAAGAINRINRLGFIDPAIFTGSRFNPDRHITRAEFFSLVVNALGATATGNVSGFTDIEPNSWQLEIVSIANKIGIANGYPDGTMRPNDNILRQEAATLVARTMGMSSEAEWNLTRFHDAAFISAYARTYVAAFVDRGLLSGYPDGSFRPSAFITRAEAVMIIDRVFNHVYMPETGFRNVYLQGGLLIQTPGAELRDAVIDGDVIIGDGVGNGSVYITNTTINGRLVIRGGGPNTIALSNTEVSEGIYVASYAADTRISVTDNSYVPTLEAVSGFTLAGSGVPEIIILENASLNAIVNLTGVNLNDLIINGSGTQVRLNSGHIINTRINDGGQGVSINLAANTSIGHLTISAPNAAVTGTGNIRNLIINHSGAIVAQNPELLTLGINVIATVAGQSVASTESQWSNNIDRVSGDSPLKVELLENTAAQAPFDQSVLRLSMVAGRTSTEVHLSQSAASRIPLTQRGNRWGYWTGYFIPAPPEAGSRASITYSLVDGEPITLPPRALDTYRGRQGLLIYLPVFREQGREVGLVREFLHINWGGHLTENVQFVSSTMHLASLNSTQTAALQRDFDNRIMYSIQTGASPYTGAEATRRILNSDNPLGLPSTSNKALDAMNRAVTASEVRSILEDPQFSRDLNIDTSGNSQYSALSDAGKQWVAEQVLAARRTTFATPSAVKTAFDRAVQSRLAAETTLLGQINNSADYAALRRIIETAANAAILQFQTGAEPYRSFTASQKDAMADYLWRLRQYRSIQEVIDAIKRYLGDPANAPGGGDGTDIRDLQIRRIAVNPTSVTFAEGNTRDITLTVELVDGSRLEPSRVASLIRDGYITYAWSGGTTLSLVGSVSRPDPNSNVYRVMCVHDGINTTNRTDRLTITLTFPPDSTQRPLTATVNFTAEQKRWATGISLPSEVRLIGGETQLVRATLTPANSNVNITWSIQPAGFATIRPLPDGRVEVTALRDINGIAELTAVTEIMPEGRGQLKATTKVMVFRDENDVLVDPSDIIMMPGTTRLITTYTYSPSALLRWDVVPVEHEDAELKLVDVSQGGLISAPRPPRRPLTIPPGGQTPQDSAVVTVSVIGSSPPRSANVNVTIRQDSGITMFVERAVMHNTEKQQLQINASDLSMQGQRFWVEVTGGLGGSAARLITPNPVRVTDEIYIQADNTNVGIVTVRLHASSAMDNPITKELNIVVSPKSVDDVEFYHTALRRHNDGKPDIVRETTYGHILEMHIAERPVVTPLVPAEQGQSTPLWPGYVALGSGMTWREYDSDQNRQILREVKTEYDIGDDAHYVVGRDGTRVVVDGADVDFFRWFRDKDGNTSKPPGFTGRMETDPVTLKVYYWISGYFIFSTPSRVVDAIERDAHMNLVGSTVLNAEGGTFRARETMFTGLAAVMISPARGRLTEDQLAEWGNLFYDVVDMYETNGNLNSLIARQTGFSLEKWDGTEWIPETTIDLYTEPNVRALVDQAYGPGEYRIVDMNGRHVSTPRPSVIVIRDPNRNNNTFFVRLLPNDLLMPRSPWLNPPAGNPPIFWRPPTGLTDPGIQGLIPIVPGSNDQYNFRLPGDDTETEDIEYPKLIATMRATDSPTPAAVGTSHLGAQTYFVEMRNQFTPAPPSMDLTYRVYYLIQQHSKLGFSLVGTDGWAPDNQILRQEAVVSPQYPNSIPYIEYVLTVTAPTVFNASVTQGDTGDVYGIPGIALAITQANINPLQPMSFSSTNTYVFDVLPSGIYQAREEGAAILSITQGANTALINITVAAAFTVEMGIPSLLHSANVKAAAPGMIFDAQTEFRQNTNGVFSPGLVTFAPAVPPVVGLDATATGATLGYLNITIHHPSVLQPASVRVRVVATGLGVNPLMIGIETSAATIPGIVATAAAAGIDMTSAVFESTDNSIMTISSEGIITSRRAGRVDVIIRERGGNKSARVTLEVTNNRSMMTPAPTPSVVPSPTPTPPAVDPVNPVTPAPAPAPLPPPAPVITALALRDVAGVGIGKTMTLVAYVTPYNADKSGVRWSSSDETVATVTGGLVTGIKAGTATITVTNASGEIKASCTVTVRSDARPITSISISRQTLALAAGATSTLSITIRPSNATIRGVTWTSSNESVARVEPNGKVIAVSAGTAVITATSDSGAKTAACTVTVRIAVESVTLPVTDITLKIGETYQINPVINPSNATNNRATYSSRAATTASVSATGLVTARRTGTTTITVTVDGKTATLRVTVTR